MDQFENLATGLSNKIWQKIMILDRIKTDTGIAGANTVAAVGQVKSAPDEAATPELTTR